MTWKVNKLSMEKMTCITKRSKIHNKLLQMANKMVKRKKMLSILITPMNLPRKDLREYKLKGKMKNSLWTCREIYMILLVTSLELLTVTVVLKVFNKLKMTKN